MLITLNLQCTDTHNLTTLAASHIGFGGAWASLTENIALDMPHQHSTTPRLAELCHYLVNDITGDHHIIACGVKLPHLKADHFSALKHPLRKIKPAIIIDSIDQLLLHRIIPGTAKGKEA